MKILVISTGGTISQSHDEKGILKSDETSQTGNDFVRMLKDKLGPDISVIDATTILNKDSANMIMQDWQQIIDTIVFHYDAYDGFIITHGTETMGYATAATAFALGNLGKPVCFTGSQAAFGTLGSDSILNLENCLRVLSSRRDLVGVYLVFGTQIISGTRVVKQNEIDYDAFKCTHRFRPLGTIGAAITFNEPEIAHHLSQLQPYAKTVKSLKIRNTFENNIVVLSEFPGLDSQIVTDLANTGTKGFILKSYGSGVPNIAPDTAAFPNLRLAFKYLQEKQIPLVITSQAPTGCACMSIYEPSVLAHELGAIPAQNMTIQAAVAKLAWLLGGEKTYKEIATLMQKNLRGEII
ncbi:MAG: asparaginase domain-containing protein [Firmicutes bacterium]|nr:asparaginase domain-containing protein [Bacillota bacterium]